MLLPVIIIHTFLLQLLRDPYLQLPPRNNHQLKVPHLPRLSQSRCQRGGFSVLPSGLSGGLLPRLARRLAGN